MATNLQIKESLTSIKIMMIEDDRIMIALVRDILVIMGFKNITQHIKAQEAFDEIKRKDFDLIFCDWKMPGMDGIEFTKSLRGHYSGKARFTPIVMITGKAQEQDVKFARDAGVTEYLVKPFSVATMTQKIKALLEKPREFVIAETYKGPNRRHRENPTAIPDGVDRRED
jgi:DNA-binding response OmpR family regulator